MRMILVLIVTLFSVPLMSSEKKQIWFVINPLSGHGQSKSLKQKIEKKIDSDRYQCSLHYTERKGHAYELAKEAASQNVDIVVAVGGDGTVNEVGKALIHTRTALAIIPTGSGNGYARSLKIPTQIDAALRILNTAALLNVDTMTLNKTPFLGVAGVGFDALISKQFESSRNRGPAGYLKLISEEFKNYKPYSYHLSLDGKEVDTQAFLLTFANTPQYGNNLEIDPLAKINDGKFEVVIIKEFPDWAIPDLIFRLFSGRIDTSAYSSITRCKSVKIENEKTLAHVDGEPLTIEGPIEVEIVPHSLNVVVPARIL